MDKYNFTEPRSRQEMYLQDIIRKMNGDEPTLSEYPEPRSRQEMYLQRILSGINFGQNNSGLIYITDSASNKKYAGELKLIDGKPVLEYEELR